MQISKVPYRGWTDCVQIANNNIKLIVTTQVGPRVIFLGFQDGENLFYENPEQVGTTGGDTWKIYGGHRLWCAPEDLKTTYVADNFPIEVQEDANLVRFVAPVEPTGVEKTIEISLDEDSNQVSVHHVVTNCSRSPISLAPWALSVMRSGGVAVIPHHLHPVDQLTPTHSIVLWGYDRMSDPRWTWGDRFILLRQDPASQDAQKAGTQNRAGWAGYAVNNQLFVKRFAWNPEAEYPDLNCNFEAYTNPHMLEMESLGPLCTLEPDESTSHAEDWSLYRDVPMPHTEQEVQERILPIIR